MYVMYADGNMMRSRDIRREESNREQNGKIPEDFLCPLCQVGKDEFSEA